MKSKHIQERLVKSKKGSNRFAEVTRANNLALHLEQLGEKSRGFHTNSTLVSDMT